ncbi:MAG: hypothetical protein AABW51_04510 [Nanoarchaeota archaeon]
MKSLILKPEQIIPPDNEMGNEEVLKIYFGVMAKGHEKDIPPVLIARPSLSDRNFMLKRAGNMEICRKYFESVSQIKDAFYLIDGNHRAVAAMLCNIPIKALELEDDSDLSIIEKMAKSGEYWNHPPLPFDFNNSREVTGKLRSAVTYLEDGRYARELITLKDMVNELVFSNSLPDYMKNKYLENVSFDDVRKV